jgi:hypothetical protein
MEGMSKSVLAVGTMVSAMVLASMAAGLTAVEGASQTRTVTLLDQAPRRDEPLEQPRRVCGHLDHLITTPLPGTSARAENTSKARCTQPST